MATKMGYREKYSSSRERKNIQLDAAEDSASRKGKKSQPDTVGKTENFFSRNVRLITFLICIGVFLAFFVPIVAYEVVDYLATVRDTRPEMTLSDVVKLSEQKGKISEKQILNFKASDVDNKAGQIYYYFDVAPHYHVLAISDKQSKMLIYCQLANLETGETADVLVGDIYAFLNQKKQ